MKHFFLFLMLSLTITMFASNGDPVQGYKVGDKAADFKLKNIDGKMVSLADFPNAKGFIVVFTCNHCPYAVMYEDRINAINKKYQPLGYPVIAINPNDPEVSKGDGFEDMKVRAKEKDFSFPYLFDEGQQIFPKFGATRTPHVYLLDNSLTVQYIGAIDDNPQDEAGVSQKYLENALTALQANKPIEPNTTKAIGCSIKVKK